MPAGDNHLAVVELRKIGIAGKLPRFQQLRLVCILEIVQCDATVHAVCENNPAAVGTWNTTNRRFPVTRKRRREREIPPLPAIGHIPLSRSQQRIVVISTHKRQPVTERTYSVVQGNPILLRLFTNARIRLGGKVNPFQRRLRHAEGDKAPSADSCIGKVLVPSRTAIPNANRPP